MSISAANGERVKPPRRSPPSDVEELEVELDEKVASPNVKPSGRILGGTVEGKRRKSVAEERLIVAEKAILLKALRVSLGNTSLACLRANITRRRFYEYMNTDPAFAEEVCEIKEMAIDFAEGCLFKQMKNGSTAAAIFYLKTQARHRGYIERTQYQLPETVEGSGGESITLSEIENEVPDDSMDEIFNVIAEGVAAQRDDLVKRKEEAIRAEALKRAEENQAAGVLSGGPRLLTLKKSSTPL
jgi:hypothetical protein